jgi:hypothetical protein
MGMSLLDENWDQQDEEDDAEEIVDLRWPLALVGLNLLAFLVGKIVGPIELVGLSAGIGVVLILLSYLLWVWDRRELATVAALGTIPFWLLLALSL